MSTSATLALTPVIEAGIPGTDTCQAKCTSCLNKSNQDCLTCQFGHFLLLVDGKVRCAQCPDYSDWNDIPPSLNLFTAGDKNCLDCYANPSTWQYTRKCTRKMKVFTVTPQTTPPSPPSFVIFQLSKPELYKIKKPSGAGQPYTAQRLHGCAIQQNSEFQIYQQLELWRYQMGEVNELLSVEDTSASKIKAINQITYTCPQDNYFETLANSIINTSEQSIVSYANCIQCLQGYVLRDSDQSCIKCPDNCQTCILVADEKTVCSMCEDGYHFDLAYACKPCSSFSGLSFCTRCYFRKPNTNKMVDQDLFMRIFEQSSNNFQKWPSASEITTQANQILGQDISTYVMSCQQCSDGVAEQSSSEMTNSIQFQYIPALDHSSCVSCSSLTTCAQCDYFHLTNKKRRKLEKAYPTAELSAYGLFCTECIYTTDKARVLSLQVNTGCITGNLITDCVQHYGIQSSTSTMPELTASNADTLDMTSNTLVIKCKQCKDGKSLALDGLSCPGAVATLIANCARYQILTTDVAAKDCVACENDRILNMQVKSTNTACSSIPGKCTQKIQNCVRCYAFQPVPAEDNYLFRCIECSRGYYPTIEGCVLCGITGCDVCEELGQLHSFTNYLKYSLPTKTEFDMLKLQAQHAVKQQDKFCRKPETNPLGAEVPGYSDYLYGKRYNCISDRCNCDTSTKDVHCRLCQENRFNDFGDEFIQSISENGLQCVNCPAYCFSCAQRLQSEISNLNPFFSPTSDSLKPYQKVCNVCDRNKMPANNIVNWDSEFGRCIKCSDSTNQADNSKLCQKRVQFWYVISCDNTPTTPTLNEKNYYALWEKYPDSGQGTFTFENDDFDLDQFQEYNKNMYTYFQFYVYFITKGANTICSFTQDFQFDSGISRNVFAVRDLKLIINTIDVSHLSGSSPSYYTGQNLWAGSWSDTLKSSIGQNVVQWKLNGKINIDYFNQVEINNVQIVKDDSLTGSVYGIQIRNPLLSGSLMINNFTVGDQDATTKSEVYFMINITNPSVLVISNTTLASMKYASTFGPFKYIMDQNLQVQKFTLNITNLVLTQLYIEKATILDSPFLKSSINVNGVSLIKSQLESAQLFSDRYANVTGNYPRATLVLQNVKISESQLTDSRLIYFNAVLKLNCKNWLISKESEFQSSSQTNIPVISSNTLSFWNMTVEKGIVFFRTTLMANVKDSTASLDEATKGFQMDFFRIQQIICLETVSCILNLGTPTTGNTIRSKIHINDLEIKQVNMDLFKHDETNLISACHLNITGEDYDLEELKSQRTTNPNLKKFDYIDVDDMRVKNAQSGLIFVDNMAQMLFTELRLKSNVEIIGLSVQNVETLAINKAECSFEDDISEQKFINVTQAKLCTSQAYLFDIDQIKFSKSCFQFKEIEYQLTLQDINITQQLIKNTALLSIETQESYGSQPIYSFCQIQMLDNIIFVSAKESSATGIKISTLIKSDITFNDIIIQDSELVTFKDTIGIVPSSVGILINSILSTTYIDGMIAKNLTSIRNYNAFWVLGQFLSINNITCQDMNDQIRDNILSPVSNQGGCGFIGIQSELIISNSIFNETYSGVGGALNVQMIGQVTASIQNSQFLNSQTTLAKESVSFGGAIFVDLEKSIASSLKITQSEFNKNVAQNGGSIFVNGGSTTFSLILDNLKIQQANAVSGGFLYGQFQGQTTNNVYITNSEIGETHDLTYEFLSNFTQLEDDDVFSLLDDNSLIYLISATLTTQNNIFTDIFYQRVIYVQLGSWIDQNSHISNVHYYNNPIITCFQTMVNIRNLTVANINRIVNQQVTQEICQNLQADELQDFTHCLFHKYVIDAKSLIDLELGDNYITIANSNFSNMYCPHCTEGIVKVSINQIQSVLKSDKIPLNIQNNVFSNNTAFKAGGLYIYKKLKLSSSDDERVARNLQSTTEKNLVYPNVAQFLLIGNSFTNNQASDMAGAFYSENQELTIIKNEFKGNKAKNNGGAIIIQNTYVELKLNQVQENEAQAVAGIRLIAFQPKYQYPSSNSKYISQMDADTAIALTNMTVKMGNKFGNNSAEFGTGNIITGCVFGQFYISRQCQKCSEGTYSIAKDQKEPQCLQCPTGAVCKGSYIIILNAGYWRPNYFTALVEECKNAKANCLGQNSTSFNVNSDLKDVFIGNQLCSQGYVGALCETCDIEKQHWNDNYASAGNFACARCSELAGPNSAIIILISALTLGFIIFSVNSTLKANQERLQIRSETFQASIFRYIAEKFFQTDNGALFIKIFTNYTQIISVIATFDMSIPPGVNDTTEAAGTPIQKLIFSLDCFLIGIQGELPIEYMRLLWSFVVPIIYMGLLLASFFFYVFIKRQQPDYNVIVCGVLFLYIYYQPNLSLQFIGVLSCRKVSGINFIQAQMNQTCYTDEHNAWLGGLIIPVLITLIFIIPFLIFIRLTQSQNKLTGTNMRMRYGILYNQYTLTAYYWELLKIIQKTLIILFVNFFNNDDTSKGTSIFLILMWYAYMAHTNKPYLLEELNKLDLLSTYVCAVSMVMAVLASANSSAKQPTEFSWMFYIAVLIIAIINIYFILAMIVEIFQSQLQQMGEAGIPLKRKLLKIPCFSSCIHVSKETEPATIEALWLFLASVRREWSTLRQQNRQTIFFQAKDKVQLSDIQDIVNQRRQEQQKKEEEEKEKKKKGKQAAAKVPNEEEDQLKEKQSPIQDNKKTQGKQIEFKVSNENKDFDQLSVGSGNADQVAKKGLKINQVHPQVDSPLDSKNNQDDSRVKQSQKTVMIEQLEKDMEAFNQMEKDDANKK